jgi:predicted  nucleic acid-binding Zn-ribbon protein
VVAKVPRFIQAYAGLGRDELESRLEKAESEYGRMLDNLSSTQGRCTELLEETRLLKLEIIANEGTFRHIRQALEEGNLEAIRTFLLIGAPATAA